VSLTGDLTSLEQKLHAAAPQVKASAGAAAAKGKAALDTKGADAQESLRTLRARLLARGPRLI